MKGKIKAIWKWNKFNAFLIPGALICLYVDNWWAHLAGIFSVFVAGMVFVTSD